MRTIGATSCVTVSLRQLNSLLKDDVMIPVSRKFATAFLGLTNCENQASLTTPAKPEEKEETVDIKEIPFDS